MLVEISNRTRSRVAVKKLKQITEKFLRARRLSRAQVSVALVGDAVMRRLNRRYRGQDKSTDVLAWRDSDSGGTAPVKNYLGEVVINYQQIKRQAKLYGQTSEAELIFILVHGLLHLCGYDDKNARQTAAMERLTHQFLKQHGYD